MEENLTEATVCFSHQCSSATPPGEASGFQKRALSFPCPPLSCWVLAQPGKTGRPCRMCCVFSGVVNKKELLGCRTCDGITAERRIWWPVSTTTFTFLLERRGLQEGEKMKRTKKRFHSIAGNIKTAKLLS